MIKMAHFPAFLARKGRNKGKMGVELRPWGTNETMRVQKAGAVWLHSVELGALCPRDHDTQRMWSQDGRP